MKKGLDRVWSEPGEKQQAIKALMVQVDALRLWLASEMHEELQQPPLSEAVATLQQVIGQDLEPDPKGDGPRIREGTAEDRRVSIEDGEMRHGRKSASKSFNGYKRHIATDLDDGVILACAITPANRPEETAAPALLADAERLGDPVQELSIDRGYIKSSVVDLVRVRGGSVVCRPWRQDNQGKFSKEDFVVNLDQETVTCPAGQRVAGRPGTSAKFGPEQCDSCTLRGACTTAAPGRGRTLHVAADEQLQQQLRASARTPEGRDRLRQRVAVEHDLAHVGVKQGRRARYLGVRKNLCDVRRAAAVHNLEIAHARAA